MLGERRDPNPKIAEHSIEKKQNKAQNSARQKARELLLLNVLLNPKNVANATEKRWRKGSRISGYFSIGIEERASGNFF